MNIMTKKINAKNERIELLEYLSNEACLKRCLIYGLSSQSPICTSNTPFVFTSKLFPSITESLA